MLIEVIENEKEFYRLENDWRRLLQDSESCSIFLTWEWMSSWWHAYGDGKSLKILKVHDNGKVVGIAAFYSCIRNKFYIPFRTLQLMGDGSADSDYLDLISLRGKEEAVASAVWDYLSGISGEWDILLLNEVQADSKALSVIKINTRSADFFQEEGISECPYISLPKSWDAYLQSLKPRMRTKVRSLCRKLEDNHSVEFEICTDVDCLQEKLRSLYELHHQRWELKDQKGVFSRAGKQEFYRQMSEKFLNNDWLRFYSLKVDGKYVAHQFCFQYQGTMSLLQEGFDPDWLNNGVGNVLRAYVIRDCIERELKIYDFLAGVTPHKLSWGTELNTNARLALGRRNLKNAIYFQLPVILRKIKRMVTSAVKRVG